MTDTATKLLSVDAVRATINDARTMVERRVDTRANLIQQMLYLADFAEALLIKGNYIVRSLAVERAQKMGNYRLNYPPVNT